MANKLWIIGFMVVCAALFASASNPFVESEEHEESWEEWLHYYKDVALDTLGVEYDDYPFMKFSNDLPIAKEDFDRLLRHSIQKSGGEWDNAAALGLPKDWKVDPKCQSKEKFYYRTMDGSCNWPKDGEAEYGKAGNAFSRDVPFTYYDDGVSTPRKGPSPRELSNEFFAKTTNETGYEHTPILVGLIEFVIHDIAWSVPSQKDLQYIPVPKCDPFFDPKCEGDKKMPVWRNQPIPGTGTNSSNPRQTKNGATSWLDLSAMYGTDEEMGRKLRLGKQGKMLTQIGPDGGEYPPFNTLGLHMIGNANQSKLFATGDPRGNQDWLLMAIETLLLREHNRVCDLLVAQHPDWDDDKLYNFARIALSTKYQMIANLYQQAYFTKEMPKPRWDGLPLFRQWHGKNVLQLNPYHPYPFKPALVNNKPVTTSQEMAIGYRFHEILPTDVPLMDENGKVISTYNIVNTSFDAEGFLKVGLDAVLRGMASIKIPRFHTGTSDIYRNMRFNFGDPQEHTGFDLVAWTIYHERERGLPTFNQYFTYYTGVPEVPIRKKFEDFTTNPKYLAALKRLYANPDEVDLTVGQYLDESYYPGTTVPRSQLITSLFSLFALGIADRFSPGYSMMKCLLVQSPFNCTASNALEEMLWKPAPHMGKNARWFDKFWITELNLIDHGTSALWRLVHDNSNVKCLQKNPLFPNDKNNPIACNLSDFNPPKWKNQVIIAAVIIFVVITIYLCLKPIKPTPVAKPAAEGTKTASGTAAKSSNNTPSKKNKAKKDN